MRTWTISDGAVLTSPAKTSPLVPSMERKSPLLEDALPFTVRVPS